MSLYESSSTSRTGVFKDGQVVWMHSFVRIKDENGYPIPHLMCEYCDAVMPESCEDGA